MEAGQKDRYLQISSFLSGVAEVTRTLGTVVAGFFIHGALAWTYYIAIGLSLAFHSFDLSDERAREQE